MRVEAISSETSRAQAAQAIRATAPTQSAQKPAVAPTARPTGENRARSGLIPISVAAIRTPSVTNPVTIGPAGVTTWFVVLLFSMASILTLVFYTIKTFLHVHASGASRLRYSWRQGLLISVWITAMICLSSLSQLGMLDAILLALLLVIAEVYVRFRWP